MDNSTVTRYVIDVKESIYHTVEVELAGEHTPENEERAKQVAIEAINMYVGMPQTVLSLQTADEHDYDAELVETEVIAS